VTYPDHGGGCARGWKALAALGFILSIFTASAQTNRVVINDDFEGYATTKALKRFWGGNGSAQLVTNAPGGGQAASHEGNGVNHHGGFFLFPDATHNVVLSADFYDFATNIEQNVTVTLNGEKGPDSVSMGLRGANCYAVRVNGFGARTNWVNFKRGQLPVEGWHRFKATISVSNVIATLDLGANGTEERRVTIPVNAPVPAFTQVRFGGYAKAPIPGGTVLIDNIKLELVSVPAPEIVEAAAGSPTTVLDETTNHSPAAAERPQALVSQAETNVARGTTNGASLASVAPSPLLQGQAVKVQAMLPWAFWWISGALVLLTLVMLYLLIALRRSAALSPRPLLADASDPKLLTDGTVIAPSEEDEHWRQRALHAEAMAAKQAKILSSKVGPDLVEFAKEALVQGLYSQRNGLVEAQAKARQTLAELESRLAELHLPTQERVRAYEDRIAELEKQLGSRDDEMRELTRATLQLVREKLEQAKHEEGTRFN
jgi:hypothetical protein